MMANLLALTAKVEHEILYKYVGLDTGKDMASLYNKLFFIEPMVSLTSETYGVYG